MYECNDKMVSHPDHYQSETGLEVIDVIEAFTFDLTGIEAVDTGNALKYLCRWKKKNGLQDLKKAMWYLQNLIDHVEKLEEENAITKFDISKCRPVKVISRWKCNHCDTILETEEQDDILAICKFHMEKEHPLRPYIFGLDFTMLKPGFADKNEKEND